MSSGSPSVRTSAPDILDLPAPARRRATAATCTSSRVRSRPATGGRSRARASRPTGCPRPGLPRSTRWTRCGCPSAVQPRDLRALGRRSRPDPRSFRCGSRCSCVPASPDLPTRSRRRACVPVPVGAAPRGAQGLEACCSRAYLERSAAGRWRRARAARRRRARDEDDGRRPGAARALERIAECIRDLGRDLDDIPEIVVVNGPARRHAARRPDGAVPCLRPAVPRRGLVPAHARGAGDGARGRHDAVRRTARVPERRERVPGRRRRPSSTFSDEVARELPHFRGHRWAEPSQFAR